VNTTREEIWQTVVGLVEEVSEDRDLGASLSRETGLFTDLAFDSLTTVVLGTAIQERYHCPMPFAALLAEVGQRDQRDLTIGELADFVEAHLRRRE
jgi:acyl carrier protein